MERTPPDPSEMRSGQARVMLNGLGQARVMLNGLRHGEHLPVAVVRFGWESQQATVLMPMPAQQDRPDESGQRRGAFVVDDTVEQSRILRACPTFCRFPADDGMHASCFTPLACRRGFGLLCGSAGGCDETESGALDL